MVNLSELRTLHLTFWQECSKKSFIIQLILVLLLVSYLRDTIFIRPPVVILTFVGAFISLPFFLLQPIWGIFAVIILTASLISDMVLPLIPFIRGSIHITDALLMIMFLFIIGRKLFYKFFYRYNYPIVRTPLDILVALFFLAQVFGLINALVLQKGDFNTAFRSFRSIAYYPLFFLITNLVKNKKDISFFVRGVFFIALITAMANIVQQFLGTSSPILWGRVETLETTGFGEYAGVVRSTPPGLLFIYLSLITLICVVVIQGGSTTAFTRIVILGVGLIFTFYRNLWMTALLAIFIFFSLTTVKQKVRITLWSLVGIWAIIIVSLLPAASSKGTPNKTILATQQRVFSIFNVKGTSSDTLGSRMEENERAIRRIKEHPILGVGFVDLLSKEKRWFFSGGWFGSSVESLHNSVLDILLRLGLVGFIPFLWISALFLLRGFRNWKKINDPFLQAICIGFTVSYVGTFFSGIFDPFFNCWRGVIAIATMWGTNEAIYRVEGIEDKR